MRSIMDYKQNISSIITSLLIAMLLTACGHELSSGNKLEPDSLQIIGSPPAKIYYDTQIEFELGASGGDGVYRYRYIQNPEDPDDIDDTFEFNPVELTIDDSGGAKPLFFVKGIHKSVDGATLDDLPVGKYSFQIEITDGKNTKVQDYEFELAISNLNFTSNSLSSTEGSVFTTPADKFIEARQSGNNRICRRINDNLFEKKTLPNGITVYPFVIEITFDVTILERVEFFYRFSSNYNEELPERHPSNIGLARPNVDYLDEERSVVFEAGEGACVIYINVLDDAIIEGRESLNIEVYDREGGLIENLQEKINIDINDDEPLPSYETKKIIRNEGDTIVTSFSLITPYEFPLSINVGVDTAKTTASSDDYILSPESGTVVIEAGELQASYTVALLANSDETTSTSDDFISIVTGLDELLDLDPYEITINEWPLNNAQEIITSSSSNNEEALAINVNSFGVVTALIKSVSAFNEEQSIVLARNRDGSSLKLVDTVLGKIVIGKQGVNVKPVAIGSYVVNTVDHIMVVANVDGLYSSTHRGGGDFIVAVYKLEESGFYALESVEQYGSEGDDVALGAEFDDAGNVYVFGETTGQEFDGGLNSEVNQGGQNGKDGFVYKIDAVKNKSLWTSPRFIGTDNDDKALALGLGRSDLVVLAENLNSDKDVFARKLSAVTGQDVPDIKQVIISSLDADVGTAITMDHNGSNFLMLVDSTSTLPDAIPTPSLSLDINLITFDGEGTEVSSKSYSTSAKDVSVDIKALTKRDFFAIGGYTEGEFSGNAKKGTSGNDAFIAILNTGESEELLENEILQFGTVGDDRLIDIANVSENKFLVLWSEDHTEGGGTITYRISAFSNDGVMLSAEP